MIGFIGAGSLGGAIIRGVLKAEVVTPNELRFTRANTDAAQLLSEELGIGYANSNAQLVAELGANAVVIVAVKPHLVAGVLAEIKDVAAANATTVVSVAAGVSLAALESQLAPQQAVIRTMPNVASAIGAGVTAIAANKATTEAQLARVEEIFRACGITARIAEKDFAAFSAIAGCSPAWTFTYIDALARGALAAGMRKDEALRIAAQSVAGAAQLALLRLRESDTRPQALVDTVTSPGGTTIAGLIALEEAGFSPAVVKGVRAAIARDSELS